MLLCSSANCHLRPQWAWCQRAMSMTVAGIRTTATTSATGTKHSTVSTTASCASSFPAKAFAPDFHSHLVVCVCDLSYFLSCDDLID